MFTLPSESTGRNTTGKPSSARCCAAFRTQGCSIAVVTILLRTGFPGAGALRPRSYIVMNTVLFDSEPPEVKYTLPGSRAPTSAATFARASSISARARRPDSCMLDAFAYTSSACVMRSRTSGLSGVVAL